MDIGVNRSMRHLEMDRLVSLSHQVLLENSRAIDSFCKMPASANTEGKA